MKKALLFLWVTISLATSLHAEEFLFKNPAGFTEIRKADPLFEETMKNAVRRGRLLKMYLPEHMAHQYKHGNSSLVTRQVLICAPLAEKTSMDPKEAELLAKSLEGMFIGFATVPRGRMDTPAQDIEHRQTALKNSLASGQPLLYSSQRTQTAWLYSYLIHYNMDSTSGKYFLSTAMSSAVVPLKDRVLFITASSIPEGGDAESELEWVKDTASAFAAALVKSDSAKK